MPYPKPQDQPPAYAPSDNPTPTSSRRLVSQPTLPNHTTLSSRLSLATKNGIYTPSQYLSLTFSLMVCYRGTFEPIVVAVDEEYDALLDDFDYIFRQIIPSEKSLRLEKMKVVWEDGWKERWSSYDSSYVDRQWHSVVQPRNLVAMLRLMKGQSDRSYLEIS